MLIASESDCLDLIIGLPLDKAAQVLEESCLSKTTKNKVWQAYLTQTQQSSESVSAQQPRQLQQQQQFQRLRTGWNTVSL